MSNSVNNTAIKKLKLLVTVVDRAKGEFYLDVLSQYEVNCQMVLPGQGTATSDIVDLLGLNSNKAVLFSLIRDDMTEEIIKALETKFETIRGGKGIAFAIPLSSVIGVNVYQFLSNNRLKKGD